MKRRDFDRLCTHLVVPQLNGWVCRGEWLVRSEAALVLSGIRLNPSAFSKEDFGLNAVAIPLYCVEVPVAMWESRVIDPPKGAGFYTWSVSPENGATAERAAEALVRAIHQVVGPWISERNDPAKLLAKLSESDDYDTEPGIARMSAPSAAAIESFTEAMRIIDRHDAYWRGTDFDTDPVVNAVREELRSWANTIRAGPLDVRRRVLEASKEGLKSLKLESRVELVRPEWWPVAEWSSEIRG